MKFKTCVEARRFLATNAPDIRILNGVISPAKRPLTKEQSDAIEYLCDEWNFCIAGPSKDHPANDYGVP